jgi:pseudouridine-5'-phosphate glycosidase
MKSAVLVCQPLSPEEELPREKVDGAIEQARREAKEQGIHGQPLTPFLLARLSELTGGESLRANLALLLNNAKLAAQIACTLSASQQKII